MSQHNDEKRIHSVTSDRSSDSETSSSDDNMSGKDLKKYLFICSLAFMMNYSAYGGLVFLQSSMNIEEGLGTASLFAIYATSSLSTIFLIPFLIDFLGAKSAILLGEVGIIAFTAANFYPSWYTMLPVALFHGLTESASWAGASVYVTYLGEQYWQQKCRKLSKINKKRESFIYRFLSIFYVFVYLAQVVGNALVYVVLFNLKDVDETNNGESSLSPPSGITTVMMNTREATFGGNTSSELNYCGAKECQSEFIYNQESENLDKYKPNQLSVYLLLGVFFIMQITFTLVHAFAMPKIPTKFESKCEENKAMMSSRDDLEPVLRTSSSSSNRVCKAVKTELKHTFHHFISPLHLLVFPILFYNGMFIAFNVTEFTRAYVSCTLGVEQIGLVMVLYGMSSMLISLLSTKLLPCLGRTIVFFICLFMHISVYFLCLFWEPTSYNWWVVYVIAVCMGSCDGAITNLLQAMVAVYFRERLGIAFSAKNFAINLGIVAGTGISTSFCIYTKLYILMGLLAISAVTYVFAEILFRNIKRKSITKNISETF